MKRTIYLSIIVFTLLTVACNRPKDKTTQPIVDNNQTTTDSIYNSNPKVMALLQNIYNNELPFEFLSAKMKTKAQMGNINQSFNTQLRWHKNNKIWMTMSIFGYEGAKDLIEPY
ncbi:MAG: DUF4292 domain-containing protein, partial [Romboutsia sp.]|nr:DUF4292 domain-containing protein [Romboutsia sp.]